MNEVPLGRRAAAEFIGTGFLTLCIIGSGIAAARLNPGDAGFQLLLNALATGLGLMAIILAVGAASGGQLNPVITLVGYLTGGLALRVAFVYLAAQVAGAAVGAIVANVTFGLPLVEVAEQTRASGSLWASEVVATLGLVLVVYGLIRSGRAGAVPYGVGAYITAAILFTSSTSFANPAATIARSLSNTFAGIAPTSVPMFVLAEIAGGLLGLLVVAALFPQKHPGSA